MSSPIAVVRSIPVLGFLVMLHASASGQILADSKAEFSGVQGQEGWSYGYRIYPPDGGSDDYDPTADFIAFAGGEGQGDWDGVSQIWNSAGQAWDLNTEPAAPWTVLASESVHPNSIDSAPNEEHWVIRRWTADELTADTLIQINWNTRKENTAGGNGVTGGIWINGTRLTSVAIAGTDGVGVTQTNYVVAKKGDRIDLVLTPVGTDGGRGDGSDGSLHGMTIERPADTDSDGLPDSWEFQYATNLTTLGSTDDPDGDTLDNATELARTTNPVSDDTDSDGLADGVETDTGTFVSATNTGTDPLNPDTDGDGRRDGDEVNGAIKTDVFDPDSDDDTYTDGAEVWNGHDPNDASDTLVSSLIADSNTEFSGVQGQDGWRHGYRNATADGGATDYDPVANFTPFPGGADAGEWEQDIQVWTGSMWDLNTASAAPWTELGPENVHPSGPNPVHWVIRRWEPTELTEVSPLALRYHVRKGNPGCGNGVTVGIYIDGRLADSVTIAFNDTVGVLRTYFANVSPTNKIDLILSPRGIDGGDQDGCDGSNYYLHVDPVLPDVAIQPNGDLFIPTGSGDTDGDGMPDVWEEIYFPGALATLTATGDYDNDGLTDRQEYTRDSDPTKPDTDGDGLGDNVETKTGVFVSANDTGTDPRKADSDSDTLSDSAEVSGNPATNPNKADTDGDTFLDPDELAGGTNPNDPADNPLAFVIANSIAEFSGVQGSNGWFNGYRNYTADGGLAGSVTNYNPTTEFIPYAGGEGQGDWDGVTQMWNNGAWDLNTESAGPWTFQGPQEIHPNGENSDPFEEHWAIRRWVADELTNDTPVTIIWQVRKSNPAGGGVTGALFVNGVLADSQNLSGTDTTNATRRYSTVLKKGDIVDLAITPENTDGTRGDGADGSITWFWVDARQQVAGLTILSKSFSPTEGFSLTWESEPGAVYDVEATFDFKTWGKVRTAQPGGGATTSYTDPPAAGAPGRFYRIVKQ